MRDPANSRVPHFHNLKNANERKDTMLISMIRSGSVDIWGVIIYILSTLMVVFLVLPFHEWAHGFVAYKLGDKTAKLSGRLTLNPLAHVDPLGAALLLLIGFGWAKPVPVNSRNFKNPKVGMAISALAGPVANLIAAIAAGLVMNGLITILIHSHLYYSTASFWYYVLMFFRYLMIINIGLAVFNFIPVPPLDGSKILMAFLPDRACMRLYAHEHIFSIALFVLIMAGGLSSFLGAAQTLLYNGIDYITELPFSWSW